MTQRGRERTELWNNEGFSYLTTNSEFFTKKELPTRKVISRDYGDQLWCLGYEDKDMMYRRKKFLQPGVIKSNREIEGPISKSTYTNDFTKEQFLKTSIVEKKLVPKFKSVHIGLEYGSEKFNALMNRPRRSIPKELGIVKLNEEYKCCGLQHFRDVLERVPDKQRDQLLISKKLNYALTTPIAGL